MELYLLIGFFVRWFGFWGLQVIHNFMKKTGPVFAAHVLPLRKSDILVITAPGEVSEEAATRLKGFFSENIPGNKALVLGSGMTLSVVQRYGEE